jgi:hypothetical protein
LQEKRWDELIEGCRISVNLSGETVAETLLLDSDVEVEEFKLAREWDFVLPHLVERNAEKLTEAEENIFCCPRVFLNECDGSLKGVEEEVWLDLHAQSFEFRGGEASLKLCLGDLAQANLILQAKEGCKRDDDAVTET